MSRIIDLMDIIFFILNIKLTNLTVFLSNYIKILSCYNIFNLLILFIDGFKVLKSINNSLNLMSLYCKSINKLKI